MLDDAQEGDMTTDPTPATRPTTAPRRGSLRVYLGAAPGVGKTFAMLGEGKRRLSRGTDVVVGYVELHPRPKTLAELEGLEIVPRRLVEHRGTQYEEMDVDAVLLRRPAVALVDELAHTNAPGGRNSKRWQDIEELLAAGIDVITTVNVQHIESLNDVIAQVTGTTQRETVPDSVVRGAAQIELVDMSPEALRRRLAHGNVYPAEKVDAALSNYFRVGNLTALRELALLWLADRVDEGLLKYRTDHHVEQSWPTRERIVVAITGDDFSEVLIRRGARVAARTSAAELLVVYVQSGDGVRRTSPVALEGYRELTLSLGGSYHEVFGDDVAEAILAFARGVNATQIVIGTTRRSRFWSIWTPGVGSEVVRLSGPIDVHTVSYLDGDEARVRRTSAGRFRPLSAARVRAGWLLAIIGPIVLTAALAATRDLHDFIVELLLYLVVVVAVALVGGLWPSLAAAIIGSLLLNYFFSDPIHTFTITQPSNIAALIIFALVGVLVAGVVDRSARARRDALEATTRADQLAALARQVLRDELDLSHLVEQLIEVTSISGCVIEEKRDAQWTTLASAGDLPSDTAGSTIDVGSTFRLRLNASGTDARDRQVLEAYAAHAAAINEHQRLSHEAAQARAEMAGNQMRVALLAAVSHDLRTPIASIKAAASTLRLPDAALTDVEQDTLFADIDESADRLTGLVGNLLDMSRLQTGALRPVMRDESVDAVVLAAIRTVPRTDRLVLDIPETLPLVHTDAGLLERVIANVVENALKYSGDGTIEVRASATMDHVQIRIVDHGPGVDDQHKGEMFGAFQRLGDAPAGTGVGLGLAVASGLCSAIGAEIVPEDTPGGGLTMSVSLPIAHP